MSKKSKASADPVDMSECEKRSWLQSRAIAIYKETYPYGSLANHVWAECYKIAVEEWELKND